MSDNDEDDNVDLQLLQRLGLSMDSFSSEEETEGSGMVDNFEEIMTILTASSSKQSSFATRLEMADMLANWHHLSSEKSKEYLYSHPQQTNNHKAKRILQVIQTLLQSTKDVKIASSLANGICNTFSMTNYGPAMAPSVIIGPIQSAIGLQIRDSQPLQADAEPQFRAECVTALMRCLPYGDTIRNITMPENTIDILASFLLCTAAPSVQQSAQSALSTLAMYHPELFTGHLGPIFQAIRIHPTASLSILGQIKNGFEEDPQPYIDNLEYFFDIGLATSFSILQQIATQNAIVLRPHVNRIRNIIMVKADALYSTSAMTWLKELAIADSVPLDMVQELYETALKGSNSGVEYAYIMLVGACGRQRNHADAAIELLVQMLQDARLPNQALSVVLNELNNLKETSSPSFFKPFMPVIQKYESSNAVLVQQMQDWVAGRSLEQLMDRVNGLEQRIDSLGLTLQNLEETTAKLLLLTTKKDQSYSTTISIVLLIHSLLFLLVVGVKEYLERFGYFEARREIN